MSCVTVEPGGAVVKLSLDNTIMRFHAIWLRDNARDSKTRDPISGQRLIALREIPSGTLISDAQIEADGLKVTFEPEKKVICYDFDWLIENNYDKGKNLRKGWISADQETWDSELDLLPSCEFNLLMKKSTSTLNWMADVRKYGFGKITKGPVEEGALFKIIDLFGFVRETNYGKHFEVRTEVNPSNLAYTGLALQAHTDNPYRDPVPTIQLLYCLESSAAGGENMLVDGFRAVRRLRDENKEYFDLLSKYSARFEYKNNKDVHLKSRRPIIELSSDGELLAIRFNNRSMSAVNDVPFNEMSKWYAAYRRLSEIIDEPDMEITFRLDPGESFIVDNTRVLHARKGYSGTGKRWLQGCYADKDGLNSAFHSLKKSLAEETHNEA
jgi:gamma-butyrobetaine dioxygenase